MDALSVTADTQFNEWANIHLKVQEQLTVNNERTCLVVQNLLLWYLNILFYIKSRFYCNKFLCCEQKHNQFDEEADGQAQPVILFFDE